MTQMCFVAEKNSGQGQCHMHDSKTARRKHEKRETLHCMFSHLPIHCHSCLSMFHMVPLNLGLHLPTNSVIFPFYASIYI